MSQSLLFVLIATLPLAALGFGLAWLAERAALEARARVALWQLALLAPLALAPAVLGVAQLRAVRPAPAAAVVQPLAPSSLALSTSAPPVAAIPAIVPPAPAAVAAAPVSKPPFPLAASILGLIAAGALMQLGLRLARGRATARLLRHSEPCLDAALIARLDRCAARMRVKPPTLRLWQGGEPVLAGSLSPAILLPARLTRGESPERLDHIFAHELAHLRAGDHWRMPALDLLAALLWFNPVIAACALRLRAAQEEACDAAALTGADRQARRAYAETLVAALKASAAPEPALAFTGWRRTPVVVKRLRAVLRPPAASRRRSGLTLTASALVLTAALGGAAAAIAASLPAAPPAAAKPATPPAAKTPATSAAAAQARASAARPASAAPAGSPSSLSAAELSALAALQARSGDASVSAAQAAVDQAQAQVANTQQLYDVGAAANSQLMQAKTDLAQAQSQLLKAQTDRLYVANASSAQRAADPLPSRASIKCDVNKSGGMTNCADPDLEFASAVRALADAKQAVELARQQLNQVSDWSDPDVIAELTQDKTLQDLQAQLNKLGDTYGPNSPQIVSLTGQAQRRAEVLMKVAQVRFQAAQMHQEELQARLDALMTNSLGPKP